MGLEMEEDGRINRPFHNTMDWFNRRLFGMQPRSVENHQGGIRNSTSLGAVSLLLQTMSVSAKYAGTVNTDVTDDEMRF